MRGEQRKASDIRASMYSMALTSSMHRLFRIPDSTISRAAGHAEPPSLSRHAPDTYSKARGSVDVAAATTRNSAQEPEGEFQDR